MKLYHVFEIYSSFNNGEFDKLLATFNNLADATKFAELVVNESLNKDQWEKRSPLLWAWQGYDQDSKFIEIHEATLNVPL